MPLILRNWNGGAKQKQMPTTALAANTTMPHALRSAACTLSPAERCHESTLKLGPSARRVPIQTTLESRFVFRLTHESPIGFPLHGCRTYRCAIFRMVRSESYPFRTQAALPYARRSRRPSMASCALPCQGSRGIDVESRKTLASSFPCQQEHLAKGQLLHQGRIAPGNECRSELKGRSVEEAIKLVQIKLLL